ncbi:hypothetical protein BKA62DRAFT_683981 [Auriculariales sp. MPI-PUGE-AT-0066]|nr:hypothetical protein BKA62DRAFT_683981 [Auriculariales sp. MPI-PUGE-AT-0066]
MLARRPQTVLIAGLLLVIVGTFVYLSPSSIPGPNSASSYSFSRFGSYFGKSTCPNPLLPAAPLSTREHICQTMSTQVDVKLDVQVCFAPDVANQGYFTIARTSATECELAEKKNPSLMPEENKLLRMRGPDTFHIDIDGEQRWATETDPEYLGNCKYKYPFNLAFAGPMKVTIYLAFSNFRAVDETEIMLLQWDLGKYILTGQSQTIWPPATAAQGCPKISAIPTLPDWRSASDEKYLSTVPECSRREATKGRYLRAHWSERHTFNGFIFQPDGCRWTSPFLIDEDPAVIQQNSHVRYAFDVMSYVYAGNWTQYKRVPVMKALKKTLSLGPVNMTFIWDSVLRETTFDLSCEKIREFDIIVMGSSHHNLVMTGEADHDRQYTVHDFGLLISGLAKKLSPEACPGQKMPRVIWTGSTARPVRMVLPPKSHPLNHGWKDARVNPRLTLFGHEAWQALKDLPGSARVNLYDLSMSLANDFVDGLHMIITDVQAAFVQELHQKLWLTQPAFAHSS